MNTVSPGQVFVEGGFWDNIKRNDPEGFASTIESCPMGRMGTASEIAKVVVFLSSPAASFVAGANWISDGNLTNHIQN